MKKSEIVTELALMYGLPKKRAEEIVKGVFDEMTEALANSERIEFRGLGTFSAKEYDGYKGRNPQTGEEVEVKPKKRIRFRMSEVLFDKMNKKFEDGADSE